jgi:hypothetical protein
MLDAAGRHILKNSNIPVVVNGLLLHLLHPDFSGRSVVFIGKQLFSNLKWGNKELFIFRDTELQMICLPAYSLFFQYKFKTACLCKWWGQWDFILLK